MSTSRLTILATTLAASPGEEGAEFLGDAHQHRAVAQRFAPLLEQLGEVVWLDRPESRLEYAIHRARQQGRIPISLAFTPFQQHFPARSAPNVIYPLWPFSELPGEPVNCNPRYHWPRMSRTVQLILTATQFTSAAFVRAGVRTPAEVVPIPVSDSYFAMPGWRQVAPVELTLRCKLLHQGVGAAPPRHGAPAPPPAFARIVRMARTAYAGRVKPWIPPVLQHAISGSARLLRRSNTMPPAPPSLDGSAAIGGVVYTMQLDPGLRREWRDVMSAFVWALRDCEDALLVLCLTSPEASIPQHVEAITRFHKRLSAMRHKCRILVLPDAISPEDMLRLAEGTTYHVNATRAEGACLPLQEMLAAGRPGISPAHSAMSDYFDADVGFVVESHPEPCWLPGDPTEKFRTTQHRLVWQSLHDQFQASYALARQPARYAALAERGRERMRQWAATDRVLPLLREALGPVILQAQQWPAGAPWLADRRESSGGKEDMAA